MGLNSSGGATSANQTTELTTLSSIDSKVLTDVQLRATPVPICGTVTANVPTAAVTYSAAATFAPPATPTDMFRIRGSATKTIRVYKISFSGIQTTDGVNQFFLIKRNGANSGGAISTAFGAPHDSNSAATATVAGYYTVNATSLGAGNNIGLVYLNCPAIGTVGTSRLIHEWDFNSQGLEPIVLRGTAQSLAINFNGATLPAGFTMSASITWTEE